MKKKSREVTEFSDMLAIMERCDVCRVAFNDDEVPYILPLNFKMAEKDGHVTLWFHGASEGRKFEVMGHDSRCSFEMDSAHRLISDRNTLYCTFQYESVIGRGRISVVRDEDKVEALQMLNNRYHPEGFAVNMASVPHTTVLRLDVESMTGKSNVGKISMAAAAKAQSYEELLAQARSLAEGETDAVSVMANIAAMIHHRFGFWWTGFYMVRGEELVLGPFQGSVACMHIARGRGVCGTSWAEDRTVVVPDVEQFPGHIACSSESRSEIVVPVRQGGKVVAVLDIDSERLSTFDEVDAQWLEKIVTVVPMLSQ